MLISEIRQRGWDRVTDSFVNPLVSYIACSVIVFFLGGIYFLLSLLGKGSIGLSLLIALIGLIISLVIGALYMSYSFAYVRFNRGEDSSIIKNTFSDLFGRSASVFFKIVWTYIVMTFFLSISFILLIIPGIYFSFAFAMTPYIIMENPKLSALDALSLSMKMMKGHKIDLFLLYLSFVGWFLLSIFTCGILFLFVNPYMSTSFAVFYDYVKSKIEDGTQEGEVKSAELV